MLSDGFSGVVGVTGFAGSLGVVGSPGLVGSLGVVGFSGLVGSVGVVGSSLGSSVTLFLSGLNPIYINSSIVTIPLFNASLIVYSLPLTVTITYWLLIQVK